MIRRLFIQEVEECRRERTTMVNFYYEAIHILRDTPMLNSDITQTTQSQNSAATQYGEATCIPGKPCP